MDSTCRVVHGLAPVVQGRLGSSKGLAMKPHRPPPDDSTCQTRVTTSFDPLPHLPTVTRPASFVALALATRNGLKEGAKLPHHCQ